MQLPAPLQPSWQDVLLLAQMPQLLCGDDLSISNFEMGCISIRQ